MNSTKKNEFEEAPDWEKWWWKELNPTCLKCQRECKQSAKAEVVYCPQFEELNRREQ